MNKEHSFHWRKFEAAHWILSKITTNKRIAYSSFWIITNTVQEGEKDSFRYDYTTFGAKEIKKLNTEFSSEELDEAIGTLDINKHIALHPNVEDESNFAITINDEGRKAYESLYYLALRDQQKGTSVNLLNAENTLLDFLNIQWFRIRNYNLTLVALSLALITLLLRLACNR